MATSNPKFGKEYYQRYFQEHKKEIFTKLGECCAIQSRDLVGGLK